MLIPHGRYPIVAYPERHSDYKADRVYIASDYRGGLQMIDTSDLNSLMQMGSYPISDSWLPRLHSWCLSSALCSVAA